LLPLAVVTGATGPVPAGVEAEREEVEVDAEAEAWVETEEGVDAADAASVAVGFGTGVGDGRRAFDEREYIITQLSQNIHYTTLLTKLQVMRRFSSTAKLCISATALFPSASEAT
jgi:hypothetical protein